MLKTQEENIPDMCYVTGTEAQERTPKARDVPLMLGTRIKRDTMGSRVIEIVPIS